MTTKICFTALLPLFLAACPAPKTDSTTTSSAAPPSATPVASPSAPTPAAAKCDVTIVPGDRIGTKTLAGDTSVKVTIEPGKTYCVFGLTLTSTSTLADVEPRAPKTCKKALLIGATHLNCDDEGVALTFGGPPGIFSAVTIYPKEAGLKK